MMKYELAYYEAQKVLLKNNCVSDELTKEFNLNKILDYELPTLPERVEIDEHDQEKES